MHVHLYGTLNWPLMYCVTLIQPFVLSLVKVKVKVKLGHFSNYFIPGKFNLYNAINIFSL